MPVFRCSLEYAERSFYRAANGIFGKIGRIASEEVTIRHTAIKVQMLTTTPIRLRSLQHH